MSTRRITIRWDAAWLLRAGLCALLLTLVVPINGNSQDVKAQVEQALEHFKSARYDAAIDMLADLAVDARLSREDRKAVLLTLVRAYVAKNFDSQAREALVDLLELEPPLIELDPDVEPPKLMRLYYQARKERAGSYAVERADPGIKTIAILDFSNRSVDDKARFDPMEKGFSELLITQLTGTINLKVIERERIRWILDEIGLQNDPAKFDVNTAVRVGKQLGVHSILLGSFINFKDKLWLGARLVKVETSEILMTEEVNGKTDKFFDLTRRLGKKVAGKIDVAITNKEIEARTATKSLEAMLAYSEGLDLLERGEYEAALQKFKQALDFDPGYEKARLKLESIKSLIG